MRRLFQKWLFLFVFGAFLITFVASWRIHSSLAEASAKELLNVKLETAKQQVARTQENLETVVALSNNAALAKARAFAALIQANPSITQEPNALDDLRLILDVDELHVSNAAGILIASHPVAYKGYNMHASEQTREFIPAISQADFALVQAPRPNGILKILTQYAGVARRDAPGIVQIGYRPTRLEEAMKVADVKTIAQGFQIGHAGKLRILPRQGDEPPEHFYYEAVDGVPSLCLAEPCGDYLLIGNLPEAEMYVSRNQVLRILIVANLILFTIIFLLVSWLLQHVVIRGIYSVNASLNEITNGNLNEEVRVHTTTEFQDLSSGINATVSALKRSIENEARRIDAELEMGRTIQSSVLPVEFPDTPAYAIVAKMYPAKEVGGDFYDFFDIDEHHQAAIVADVSGKGITAALYMMNAKALLKEHLHAGRAPDEAFMLANRELCANNQAHMFLTAFLAVLDTRTGELVCVNAGHNPPAWQHQGAPWDYLRIKHGMALSVSPRAKYTAVTLQLAPGDTLLLYTDGVTEAMSPTGEQFGEARFLAFLNAMPTTGLERLEMLRHELNIFANGTAQSDDITLLSLTYKG